MQHSGKSPARKAANTHILLLDRSRLTLRQKMGVVKRRGKRKQRDEDMAESETNRQADIRYKQPLAMREE